MNEYIVGFFPIFVFLLGLGGVFSLLAYAVIEDKFRFLLLVIGIFMISIAYIIYQEGIKYSDEYRQRAMLFCTSHGYEVNIDSDYFDRLCYELKGDTMNYHQMRYIKEQDRFVFEIKETIE